MEENSKKPENRPVTDSLQRLVRADLDSGRGFRELCRLAAVNVSTLQRVLAGQAVTTDTADKIAAALGLELRMIARKQRERNQ